MRAVQEEDARVAAEALADRLSTQREEEEDAVDFAWDQYKAYGDEVAFYE